MKLDILISLYKLLKFVWQHPLNRTARWAAIGRLIRWQIASRLMEGPIAFPFANGSFLFATRGMSGATGNWYCGLAEYEDMSFVSDILEEDDLFIDIGANIGAYSILAARVGANVVSIEPIPATFAALYRNIILNRFSVRIDALNIGLGAASSEFKFSSDRDTVNHVLASGEVCNNSVSVPVRTLDDVIDGKKPRLIKIDVEGFETAVIEGAVNTLTNTNLLAVILELNGSGMRYGFDDDVLHAQMLNYGFQTYRYDPVNRSCQSMNMKRCVTGNTLYVRDIDTVLVRLASFKKPELAL